MSLLALFAIVLLCCLLLYVINYYWWVSKYPKGPRPYPFVGNLRQLKSKDIHLQFRELSLEYGPIFTVFLPVPVIIITNYEGVKEAYVTKGESFSARPPVPHNEDFSFGINAGIFNANGESWQENRRLAISIFRDFGMGRSLMEEKIKFSISEYLSLIEIECHMGTVDLRWPIQLMIANIITETLFGFRYSYEDSQPLVHFMNAFSSLAEMALSNLLIRFSPYTLRFVNHIPMMQRVSRKVHGPKFSLMKSFIETNTERALKTYKEDDEDNCFVHSYAKKIGSTPNITKQQLYAVCLEVFAGGQETATTTLRWATLLLAANQQVQDKARAEILRVVGSDRLPSLSDKSQMPYTSALVHEVQRRANIVQANVTRRTTENVDIMGHHIPADTTVVGDIFQIMAHDPIFENPEEFRPERYLSEDGKTLRKDLVERTIPYSAGKRQCAGEGLARAELFLVIAATLQHYHLLPTDESPIDLEPKSTVNMMPKQQNLKLVPARLYKRANTMIIVEVSLEGIILILIFLCGNTLCCLAQWTIHMSKTLRDSFGVLCKYQMFADISMLLLTTSYSMIPIEMAPPPEAFFSYWITSIAEVFYFFSGEMHVLFALHRFIFIVFPMMKQGWRSSTPLVLCFCLLVAIFRTFIMTALDANLYWVYDRKQSIWFMSNSEWTEFYEIYFEVFWSVLEIVLILVLDCVTFSRLLSKKSKLFDEGIAVDRRVEKRLILQSLCQCIPTTTVICIYFFVFPLVKDPFLMFLCTSFIWNIGNLLDATIIMFFHLPKALANRKKKSTVVVTTVTSSSAISGA